MTGQETGYQVSPAIREILVRSFVDSFHVVFPSQPHRGGATQRSKPLALFW